MHRFFALLLLLAFGKNPVHAQSNWIKDSLDLVVQATMRAEQVPGLALAVVQNGQIVLKKAYGVRALGDPTTVDTKTLFMIGSNTKAYTGTALAWLEHEGKLKLDDKVVTWLPNFRLNDACRTEQVTIRDLLCHRIGANVFLGDFTFWTSSLTREGVLRKMAALPFPYELRSRYGYCNSAFLAAGQVIPNVTAGTTWEDFVRQRFFRPLNMTQALALSEEIPLAANAARPHTLVANKAIVLPYPAIDNLAPAGSLSMHVEDMAQWILCQLDTGRYQGVQVIPKEVVLKTWQANTIVNPNTGSSYGLGWFLGNYAGKRIIQHEGGVDGFLTNSCFIPEAKLGIIVLTNTDNNAIFMSLRNQLLNVYLGLSKPNPMQLSTADWQKEQRTEQMRLDSLHTRVAAKSVLSLPLRAYAGIYTHPLYGEAEVRYDAGARTLTLFPSLHPGLRGELAYMGEHQFRCTFNNPTFGVYPLVFKEDKGKIQEMRLKVNDFIEYDAYNFVRVKSEK